MLKEAVESSTAAENPGHDPLQLFKEWQLFKGAGLYAVPVKGVTATGTAVFTL